VIETLLALMRPSPPSQMGNPMVAFLREGDNPACRERPEETLGLDSRGIVVKHFDIC
jgi:hypothetical protein